VAAREIAMLRRRLTAGDKDRLLKDARMAPAWISRVMRDVAEPAKKYPYILNGKGAALASTS
jgi:hypothetical protein